MTDSNQEGNDPLAGHDPYPREQLDVLPLRAARAELLEEIVSDQSSTPSRRLLVPVGIAAALALVAGAAWFAISGEGDTDRGEDPVVAASSDATTDVPDESEDAVAPDQAPPPDQGRKKGVRVGKVLTARECRALRRGDIDVGTLELTLEQLSKATLRSGEKGKGPLRLRPRGFYVVQDGDRVVRIDARCRVVAVRMKPGER